MKVNEESTWILQHLEKQIFKKKKMHSTLTTKEVVKFYYEQHTKNIWIEFLIL